ncbi:MAG: hypothetical protein E7578_03030 [Ruminococcaceae bacterium]|nr:hypothetical protein [Oscillospiraceae bacterium]
MNIKWLIKTLSIVLVLFIVMSTVAYIVDPFFIYRHNAEREYWLQPDYTSMGLIMNAEYDTVIVGSSMTQNFNAEKFGDAVGGDVLKVNSGGLTVTEMCEYVDLIKDTGKAEKYYICIDLHLFAKAAKEDTNRFREELCDGNVLNDFEYLLGFETWMRFVPVDLGLVLIDTIGYEYPEALKQKTDVDRAGEWANDFVYGADIVWKGYTNGTNRISVIDTNGLYDRMVERFSELMNIIEGDSAEYTFFFAPYSALYWYDSKQCGYYDDFMKAKEYMAEELLADGHEVVDFQSMEYISDLDNYRDISHYSGEITELMTADFADGSNRINTVEEIRASIAKQSEIIDSFAKENKDILGK